MPDLTGYGRLAKLTTLTDRMINDVCRDALITASRLLALQIAPHRRLHGALPMDESIDLLASKGLNEVQADGVADGLEALVAAFSTIRHDDPDSSLQQSVTTTRRGSVRSLTAVCSRCRGSTCPSVRARGS
jgi:hypothetical protein